MSCMSTDIEIEHRLKVIEEKVSQSYKILKSIKRKQSLDFWFGTLKALLFFAALYWSYQFIEPSLELFKQSYAKFQGMSESYDAIKDSQFLKAFKTNQ